MGIPSTEMDSLSKAMEETMNAIKEEEEEHRTLWATQVVPPSPPRRTSKTGVFEVAGKRTLILV
jgi:hypothetical protein